MTPTDKELIERDKAIEAIQEWIHRPHGMGMDSFGLGLREGAERAINIISSSPLVEETKKKSIVVFQCPNGHKTRILWPEPDFVIIPSCDECDEHQALIVAEEKLSIPLPQTEPPRAKEDGVFTMRDIQLAYCNGWADYKDSYSDKAFIECQTAGWVAYKAKLPAPSVPERKVTPDEVWELAHRLCMQSTRGAMLNQYRDWLRALPRESTDSPSLTSGRK
jgi:hypothetical protein